MAWLVPLFIVACTQQPTPAPAPSADVLLVVLDTVRADALSSYGNARPTSPQLDAIADAGVLFTDATAPSSWTWPSHGSLFTGEPAWRHGAHFAEPGANTFQLGGNPFHVTGLDEQLPTLAERFAAAGYRTVSVSANPLLSPDYGMTRGFEEATTHSNDDATLTAARAALVDDDPRPLLLFVNFFGAHSPFQIQPAQWVTKHRPALTTETAPAWLAPYLLKDGSRINFFHKPSPTERYGVLQYVSGDLSIPEEGLTLLRDVYEGEVLTVDLHLHQLIGSWNATGRQSGIVAVTSDHGEYLGERGLMGHARTLYPEVTQVPLVLAAPGRLPAAQRIDTPVQVQDLHDTLLDLVGLDNASDSLLPLISGASEPKTITAAAWRDDFWARELGAPFDQGYRLLRKDEQVVVVGMEQGIELYDLSSDPAMTHNLAGQHPEEAHSLAALLPAEAATTTSSITVDAETREALEALGYTGE